MPVTVTASLNVTVTGTTVPAGYEPLASADVTLEIVGATVSMTNALLAPSDPDSVHLEGLLRPGELMVERNFFISSITGEMVTDGQRVVPLGTAVQVGEPDQDDPQP